MISVGVEKRDSLWSGKERFSNCHSKECLLGYTTSHSSVSYAPAKQIDFIGKKKEAAKGINDDSASSRRRKKFDTPTLEEN